jgi:hypothetical protein
MLHHSLIASDQKSLCQSNSAFFCFGLGGGHTNRPLKYKTKKPRKTQPLSPSQSNPLTDGIHSLPHLNTWRSYAQGKFDTDIDITRHFDHLRELNSLLGCRLQILEREDLEAGLVDQALSLLHVGALQTSNDRNAQVHVRNGGDQTLRNGIAPHDTTEDVDEDSGDLRVVGDKTECLLNSLTGRASSTVKEVGGFTAVKLDDVHGGHGQTSTIDQASDVTVELDEVETKPSVG